MQAISPEESVDSILLPTGGYSSHKPQGANTIVLISYQLRRLGNHVFQLEHRKSAFVGHFWSVQTKVKKIAGLLLVE